MLSLEMYMGNLKGDCVADVCRKQRVGSERGGEKEREMLKRTSRGVGQDAIPGSAEAIAAEV